MRNFSLCKATQGEDVCKGFLQMLSKLDADRSNVISVEADGAPRMIWMKRCVCCIILKGYWKKSKAFPMLSKWEGILGKTSQKTMKQGMGKITKQDAYV
jgi:hypothetical protein